MSAPGDASDPDSPSTGLLSFYDRLRERIRRALERRSGRLGPRLAEALLLVPDVFIFLVRLLLDREVPAPQRRLIGGALAYFLLPLDLAPEVLVGAGGFVDDLVLSCAVLAQAFGSDLEPYAERHWSGSRKLGEVVGDLAQAGEALVGTRVHERLGRLLRRGARADGTGASPEGA